MKTIRHAIIGAVALSFASAINSQAIENLQVGIQSSNVVLSWPSTNIETYIVQYRSNLDTSSMWLTLTDNFPASDTNLTVFVHSNAVQAPIPGSVGGTNSGGGGGITPPGPGGDIGTAGIGFYRVVRDGVHVWGITNGATVYGELVTPIEFAVGSTDQIIGVTFYDQDNSPLIGANAFGTNNNWTLVWNTTMSFNGDYDIHAEINFASDDSVVSQPVHVTVNNLISFPNYFSRIYGDEMWIYAQTTPDTSYTIDMYDEDTNYIGTFTDYSDDSGYISFIWDLTDGNGNTFDSTNFFGVFTVDTSSENIRSKIALQTVPDKNFTATSPPHRSLTVATHPAVKNNGVVAKDGIYSDTAKQLWAQEPHWTPNNNWVVTYGLFNGDAAQNNADTYMIAGGVGEDQPYQGVLGTLDNWGLSGNVSPGNNPSAGTVFTLQDQNTRTNLLSYLADHRYENFYFFGHGNDSAIGSYNGFTLTLDQIANALVNVPLGYAGPDYPINGDPPIYVTPVDPPSIKTLANHPYRFVYIDACDTADANFCEAFAIPAITVSTNFFAAAGVESRVFIGYRDYKLNFNILSWQGYSLMTSGFLNDWENNVDANHCVGDALNDAYGSGANMDSSVWIYGAQDLKRNTRTRP